MIALVVVTMRDDGSMLLLMVKQKIVMPMLATLSPMITLEHVMVVNHLMLMVLLLVSALTVSNRKHLGLHPFGIGAGDNMTAVMLELLV